jgi:hypothetical protein
MSAPEPKVHPALPADLERAIFEIAAHARPVSIPTFMLVAWRVKTWLVKYDSWIPFCFIENNSQG